jgi:hypothetical protein
LNTYFGSKDCQKAGNLHLYLLMFLQNLHQHSTTVKTPNHPPIR